MFELRNYRDAQGREPFAEWLGSLDRVAVAKIRAALARMETGNLGDVKSVGHDVLGRREDDAP